MQDAKRKQQGIKMNHTMKSIIKSAAFLLALFGFGTLTSCNEEFAEAPVIQPFPEIGDGTYQRPLQTWQAHLGTMPGDRESNWVTGYIVGYINSDISNTMKAAVIGDGETAAAKNSNVIIAQIPYDEEVWEETGYSLDDCVPVQLPSGASRSAVNLTNHPENFNRQVSLRGTTGSKYMGVYGLRNAYEYNWGPVGRYEEPIEDISTQYFCDFTASHDISYYLERGWSKFAEKGGLTGFTVSEYNRVCYVGMSAYYGTANGGPYINWIISPEFDLAQTEQQTVSFRTEVSRVAEGTVLEVFVLTHKNPLSCEPIKLECPISTTNNVWLSSGDIDLSEFVDLGKIRIGFRYTAAKGGDGNSSDYYITDFNYGGANPDDWKVVDPASIGTYRKAETLESGKKYAMVFDDIYATQPATENSNYGRLTVEPVTFTDDAEFEFRLSKEDAFTFTKVEDDYWTIRDCYGRLIYMDNDATHSTFQFGGQGSLSDLECSWKVDDNNGKIRMKSYLRGYYLEYNANFGNVAPNSDRYTNGSRAVLYELIEE